jgi:hypothetical protein
VSYCQLTFAGPQDTGYFYLTCPKSPVVFASADGVQWVTLSDLTKVSAISYSVSRELYIASGVGSFWTSTDGMSWTQNWDVSINKVTQFSFLVDAPSDPTIIAVSAVDNTITVGTD